MATLSQVLADVRALLNDPLWDHPSQRHLLTIAVQHIQHFHNQLQNTSMPWNMAQWVLSVSPGTDEYLIMAPNFGKVRYILTKDVQTGFSPTEVRIVLPENMSQYALLGSSPANTSGWKHSAMAMAFKGAFGAAQGRFVWVQPTPTVAADYEIFYDVGEYEPGGMGDELTLPELHHVLILRIAKSALPYCQWGELDDRRRQDRIRLLADTFANDMVLFEPTFDYYIRNNRQEQTVDKQLYGEEELGYW